MHLFGWKNLVGVQEKKIAKFIIRDRSLNQHCMENLLRHLVVVSVTNAAESALVGDGTTGHYALKVVYGERYSTTIHMF
jgi:hypothetical protein